MPLQPAFAQYLQPRESPIEAPVFPTSVNELDEFTPASAHRSDLQMLDEPLGEEHTPEALLSIEQRSCFGDAPCERRRGSASVPALGDCSFMNHHRRGKPIDGNPLIEHSIQRWIATRTLIHVEAVVDLHRSRSALGRMSSMTEPRTRTSSAPLPFRRRPTPLRNDPTIGSDPGADSRNTRPFGIVAHTIDSRTVAASEKPRSLGAAPRNRRTIRMSSRERSIPTTRGALWTPAGRRSRTSTSAACCSSRGRRRLRRAHHPGWP